jgi:hypothetical protein
VERFGWCIPTLLIRKASRGYGYGSQQPNRTYAVSIESGSVCRIGLGPHVKHRLRVWVRKGRTEALKPLLDLLLQGQENAGIIRDRISSRRAQTALRRGFGNYYGW